MFHRALVPQYVIVTVAIALGVLLGVRVIDAQPPLLGWIFGAGSGLMVGAYIAAMASGVPLVGSARSFRMPPRADDDADFDAPDLEAAADAADSLNATWIDELEAELRKR